MCMATAICACRSPWPGTRGKGRAARHVVVNGRQVETRQAEIPSGGRATVEFNGVEAAHGANRCEVRMEPADDFPEDDRFWSP